MLSGALLTHYIARNNEAISQLDYQTQLKFNNFIANTYNNLGIYLLVYETSRENERQQELWDAYQNGTGGIAAPPTMSFHEYRRAGDVVPINDDGTAAWDTDYHTWNMILGQAEADGLCHGFSFGDNNHIYNPDYCTQTITQWRNANSIPISNSQAWIDTPAPKSASSVNQAGMGNIFLIAAGIGIVISESLKKQPKQ